MTNEEMKTIMTNAGIAEKEIERIDESYDFGKITEIIDEAHNPKEAFENIHRFYPELEVEKMQEQCDFIQNQVEAAFKGEESKIPLELTEEELDMVAGGGLFSWISDNWRKVTTAAILGVLGGAACAVAGGYFGATFGPVGAVIGAVVGGAVGLSMGAFAGWQSAAQAEKEQQNKK